MGPNILMGSLLARLLDMRKGARIPTGLLVDISAILEVIGQQSGSVTNLSAHLYQPPSKQ